MKRFLKYLNHTDKGFTLIEVLVVLAVMGTLASVVALKVGGFSGAGKSESYQTELHNIQTVVKVMLTESTTGILDDTVTVVAADPQNATATTDMSIIQTTDTTPLVLSDYLTGLDSDGNVNSGYAYRFGTDGTVLQTIP